MPTKHGLDSLCLPARGKAAELVVDLSNVCRNRDIDSSGDAARWDRLAAVLDAWNRWEFGSDRPAVHLIADDTLRRLLSPDDRRALKDAVTDGYAEVMGYADPAILDLAETYDCTVVSNDQFVGLRRERPWLDGNADRFVQIHGADGLFELRLVQLSPRTDYSMSRAEERDEMKARRIDLEKGRGTDLLDSVYRCDNQSCIRRAFAPEGLAIPPQKAADGSAICPGCREPLTRVGSRVDTAVMKLTPVRGGDPLRLPLPRGSVVTLGRTSGDLSLKALLHDSDLPRISREHAVIAFDERKVTIEDRGSSNGTTIERWLPSEKGYADPTSLIAGHVEHLGARDRALLGGVLSVERSGRRFPFDLGAPVVSLGQATTPATVIHEEYRD